MSIKDPIIKQIIELAEANDDVLAVWLYGSHAKGTATPDSDYDIAILFSDFIKDPLERRLRPEMLAMEWRVALGLNEDKLSLIDIHISPIPLAWEVIKLNKPLLVKNDLSAVKEEQRIYSFYEKDVCYHRRHYG